MDATANGMTVGEVKLGALMKDKARAGECFPSSLRGIASPPAKWCWCLCACWLSLAFPMLQRGAWCILSLATRVQTPGRLCTCWQCRSLCSIHFHLIPCPLAMPTCGEWSLAFIVISSVQPLCWFLLHCLPCFLDHRLLKSHCQLQRLSLVHCPQGLALVH